MKEEKVFIKRLKINYKIEGEGKPFLILHGWGSRSEKWERVGELLNKNGLKVIIPDLPGFGKSEKPSTIWTLKDYSNFVEEFVKFLNLEKFYLLGHSFGGAIAVKFSLKYPEKIEKLFLVGAACLRRKTLKQKFFYLISKIFKIFSFLPFYSLLRRAFYKFIIQKSDYLSTQGVLRDIYLKIIKEDLSKFLPFLKVPTIIIWGKKDEVVPIKDGYFMNKKIKNSKLIIIPKGDHDLEQKMPKLLTEKILENL
jgi:pimeloyl-ACP methyl ester carboxylesterase